MNLRLLTLCLLLASFSLEAQTFKAGLILGLNASQIDGDDVGVCTLANRCLLNGFHVPWRRSVMLEEIIEIHHTQKLVLLSIMNKNRIVRTFCEFRSNFRHRNMRLDNLVGVLVSQVPKQWFTLCHGLE